MPKKLLIIGRLIILGAITIGGFIVFKNNQSDIRLTSNNNNQLQQSTGQTAPSQSQQTQSIHGVNINGLQSCPKDASEPLFMVLPIEDKEFVSFRPLGFITFPGHVFGAKHSNFVINQPGESRKGVEVKFPSNAVVTQITSTESAKGSSFQVTFYPCSNFKSYFFHLGTISVVLDEAFKTGRPECKDYHFGLGDDIKKCELKMEVDVRVGDLVGTNDGAAGVDWGGVDYRVTNQFANPERYDFDYPHYVSPVPYLTADLKEKMLPKLRSYNGKIQRIEEPKWGTIAQDIAGTAQGNWFLGDKSFMNTQDFSIFLALLHDYVDPSEPLIVMGSSVKNLNRAIYSFVIQPSGLINRDFKYIKPDGNIYCFENFKAGESVGGIPLRMVGGSILMTMPDDKTLKVEYSPQNCSQSPTALSSNATTFER